MSDERHTAAAGAALDDAPAAPRQGAHPVRGALGRLFARVVPPEGLPLPAALREPPPEGPSTSTPAPSAGARDRARAEAPSAFQPRIRNGSGAAAHEGPDALDGLARALDGVLHPAIRAFYGSYWSADVEVRFDPDRAWPEAPVPLAGQALTLLQVWDRKDAETLVRNQIGHVFQARNRARRWFRRARPVPQTLFVGVLPPMGPECDLLVTVDNESGFVWLEDAARGPAVRLAADLAAFLDALVAPGP